MRLEHDFQLIVLAGRNETALDPIADSGHRSIQGGCFHFGFTNEVAQLMARVPTW